MRTGYLDTIAERSGLEIVAYVLSPFTMLRDNCVELWNDYLALVDVAEENTRLREELKRSQRSAQIAAEERAELLRLRELFKLETLRETPGFAARVLAMRFGPQAVLKTLTVNRGYMHGAVAGTPVISNAGVVGRVLRSAPHAATVLLITDPGFRLAVISQETRTPGILVGTSGSRHVLELTYVPQTSTINEGELLITAGVDGTFPKGIPAAVVTRVSPDTESLFQKVSAAPISGLDNLEEVIMLQYDGSGRPLIQRDMLPQELLPLLPPPAHPAGPPNPAGDGSGADADAPGSAATNAATAPDGSEAPPRADPNAADPSAGRPAARPARSAAPAGRAP